MESLTELNASDVARAGRPRGLEERRRRLVEESRTIAATAATCGLTDDKRVVELAREDAAVAAIQAAALEARRCPLASAAASAGGSAGAVGDVTAATLLQLRVLVLGDRKFEYRPGGDVSVAGSRRVAPVLVLLVGAASVVSAAGRMGRGGW
jgi:hypothetical protein